MCVYLYCIALESQDYLIAEAGRNISKSAAQPAAPSNISHEFTPGYSELYLARSWKLPKMETAKHLWKTCSSVWLSSLWKMSVYILVCASEPILFFRKTRRSETCKGFMLILQSIHARIHELCFLIVVYVCKCIYLWKAEENAEDCWLNREPHKCPAG